MNTGFYLILVLVFACFGVIHGFRMGITRLLSSVLGLGFGIVFARVFTPEFEGWFESWASNLCEPYYVSFLANLLCASTIYLVVYWALGLTTGILRGALSVFQVGMFNRLLGAFFYMFNMLLWLSIALNILICINSDSGLMKYEKSDDGNMVAAVMSMTPSLFGCFGADEFTHQHQLREAAKISCNFHTVENVIVIEQNIDQC